MAALLIACLALGTACAEVTPAAAQELMQAMPPSSAEEVLVIENPAMGAEFPLSEMPPEVVPFRSASAWTWQVLPAGILYPSYLAGPREPRFASQWVKVSENDWVWDLAIGGRAGILRYGTTDPLWPEGFQLDIEGAAFPRLALEEQQDLISSDFRFGVPLTYRRGPWETKFGYYHISSHLGDEFLEDHSGWERVNYVRDALLWGAAVRPTAALRLYGEVAWAFFADGGAEPWEFQAGASYSPAYPTGLPGAPFAAVNGHLREEADFGGNVVVEAGWAWKGSSGHLLRLGVHYLNGKSNQYQFFPRYEEQIGLGLWFDY
ncbi:MAG: DUF1207 domain-containing protein [Pirellulales bacterium]|nr:DUF1207 domain-containing protein [Pirellulales bacterium]